jgi:hypothetical protein
VYFIFSYCTRVLLHIVHVHMVAFSPFQKPSSILSWYQSPGSRVRFTSLVRIAAAVLVLPWPPPCLPAPRSHRRARLRGLLRARRRGTWRASAPARSRVVRVASRGGLCFWACTPARAPRGHSCLCGRPGRLVRSRAASCPRDARPPPLLCSPPTRPPPLLCSLSLSSYVSPSSAFSLCFHLSPVELVNSRCTSLVVDEHAHLRRACVTPLCSVHGLALLFSGLFSCELLCSPWHLLPFLLLVVLKSHVVQ